MTLKIQDLAWDRHKNVMVVKLINGTHGMFITQEICQNVHILSILNFMDSRIGNKCNLAHPTMTFGYSIYLKCSFLFRYLIKIDREVDYNFNPYLWPFAIVVGTCFILMLVFMVSFDYLGRTANNTCWRCCILHWRNPMLFFNFVVNVL